MSETPSVPQTAGQLARAYIEHRLADPDAPPGMKLGCVRGIPDVTELPLVDRVALLSAIAIAGSDGPYPPHLRKEACNVLIRRMATKRIAQDGAANAVLVTYFARHHDRHCTHTARDAQRIIDFLDAYWASTATNPAARARCLPAFVNAGHFMALALAHAVGAIPLLVQYLRERTTFDSGPVPPLAWDGWSALPVCADPWKLEVDVTNDLRSHPDAQYAFGSDIIMINALCGATLAKRGLNPSDDEAAITLLMLTSLVSRSLLEA